jgi:hypothetical protein
MPNFSVLENQGMGENKRMNLLFPVSSFGILESVSAKLDNTVNHDIFM